MEPKDYARKYLSIKSVKGQDVAFHEIWAILCEETKNQIQIKHVEDPYSILCLVLQMNNKWNGFVDIVGDGYIKDGLKNYFFSRLPELDQFEKKPVKNSL